MDQSKSFVLKKQVNSERTPSISIILIQGLSCSGKSTVASYLLENLENSGIKTVHLSLDSYYCDRDTNMTPEQQEVYDYDNPASFEWEGIKDTLFAYSNNKAMIPTYQFSFITKKLSKSFIPNINPDVIVFEGIYCFNLFCLNIFNVENFDCMKLPHDQIIKDEFVENKDMKYLNETFEMISIRLQISKEMLVDRRSTRDFLFRNSKNRTLEETRDRVINRVDNYVFPAHKRWGELIDLYDLMPSLLKYEMTNDSCYSTVKNLSLVMDSLLKKFGKSQQKVTFDRYLKKHLTIKK